ncbi:MAG: hypothetical protein E7580_05385 [Ruminococcaceae bacterium]|nr:hypothetical protein [Oscillospiraceae bacterium]
MNTMYKVLWIDDDDDYIEGAFELVEDTVKANNMVPQIKTYSIFEEYKEKELSHFDLDVFNMYDQIIIDYALSGTTGDKIIEDLRSRNIYTDIVFYSSNFGKMKEELRAGDRHLDGVFFAHREDLTSTVDKVIKKNLKREYSVANIRGLIMDSTSEFDYICRTTTLALFEKLPIEKQTAIVAQARAYVANALSKSKGNFETLDKITSDKSFLKKAMESVDYVMDNKDRYAIMSMVVREFDDSDIYNDDFSDEYHKNLIKPRNDLAHNKLFYGACLKKLHIAKAKQPFECDKNCHDCKSKYSIERCEEIRKIMYWYHQLFNDLIENKVE